jgi:hypothetical protein
VTAEDLVTLDALRAELAKAKADAALWEAREVEARRYFGEASDESKRLRALITTAEGVLDNHPREPIEVCPWCGWDDPRHEGHAKDCPAFSAAGVLR